MTSDNQLVLCRRMTKLPEHEGATGYYYYVPVEGSNITNHPQWPALRKEEIECENILGAALGYPWYKDDQKNFPDATDADGVCTGEHTLLTLCMEAARQLECYRALMAKWNGEK